MAYHVHLDNFEGPLDLLLYFIQRDKIDIYDIPIAHITAEYLGYLEVMEALNLSVAGEFILLAATLMRIKARMLLPRSRPADDPLIEDPRRELVQQLVEYRRFKAASEALGELAERRGARYPVGKDGASATNGASPADYLQDVSLFALMTVVREVLSKLPSRDPVVLRTEPVRLDDSIRKIRSTLASARQITLRELFVAAQQVQEVVVLFLAVLELARRGLLVFRQAAVFGEVTLQSAGEK